MSKVKFIQLSAENKSKYDEKLTEAKSSYPGAIIFVTYTDDTDNNKQKQEIWANGTKYEVGGGGGNVVYGTDMIDADGRTYIWEVDAKTGEPKKDKDGNKIPVYTHITGSEGSIYVYTGENTQTAYYWLSVNNIEKWEPFNVDAENVWFPKGVQRTEIWGSATEKHDNPTAECEGFNLKQLLENYLVKEAWVTPSLANGNTSTPDWGVGKNRVTLTVTNSNGQAFSTGSALLYGGKLTVSGSYDPLLTITQSANFTSLDDGTKSREFTLGPSQIKNLRDGYQLMEDGEYVGEFVKDKDTATGETLYYKVVLDKTYTTGSSYPTFRITRNIGGTTVQEHYNATGTNHTNTLRCNEFQCEFSDSSNIKSMLGTRAITAQGTNSSSWGCSFYKGTKNENGNITYDSNEVTDNSILIPGLTVAIGSNKYQVSEDHTKTHDGTTVQLSKSRSDLSDEKVCDVNVYLPVYEYNSGTRTELTTTKYTGSMLTIKNGSNLPLAMPDHCDDWWIEVPQCATLASFTVNTGKSYELKDDKTVEQVAIPSKSFNGQDVPYKKIKFTDGAGYTTDAKLTIKIS